MKFILVVLMLAGLIYAGRLFFDKVQETQKRRLREESGQAEVQKGPLPGFRQGFEPQLERTLAEARQQGAYALGQWLRLYRIHVSDPRLAEIELDYVLLIGPTDRAEARRVLDGLAQRVGSDSPLHKRFEQIRKTYGP
jgi:hypothetical protein